MRRDVAAAAGVSRGSCYAQGCCCCCCCCCAAAVLLCGGGGGAAAAAAAAVCFAIAACTVGSRFTFSLRTSLRRDDAAAVAVSRGSCYAQGCCCCCCCEQRQLLRAEMLLLLL